MSVFTRKFFYTSYNMPTSGTCWRTEQTSAVNLAHHNVIYLCIHLNTDHWVLKNIRHFWQILARPPASAPPHVPAINLGEKNDNKTQRRAKTAKISSWSTVTEMMLSLCECRARIMFLVHPVDDMIWFYDITVHSAAIIAIRLSFMAYFVRTYAMK